MADRPKSGSRYRQRQGSAPDGLWSWHPRRRSNECRARRVGRCRLGSARIWASRGIWPPAARLGGEPRAGDWSLLGTVFSAEATMGPRPAPGGSRVRASAGPSAAAYSRPTEFPPMKEVRRPPRNDRATGHRVPKTPPIRTRGPCTRQPTSIPFTSWANMAPWSHQVCFRRALPGVDLSSTRWADQRRSAEHLNRQCRHLRAGYV